MEFTRKPPEGNLFREYEHNLTRDFCDHVINKYEADERKSPGQVVGGMSEEIKLSTDLNVTGNPGWEEEDTVFRSSLYEAIKDYSTTLFSHYSFWANPHDKGLHLQRTDPTQGYQWHHDFCVAPDGYARFLTMIWYLNDVDGGKTEFWDGSYCQPTAGKLLLFPATWTYVHRGCPPTSGLKYICTGWLYGTVQ